MSAENADSIEEELQRLQRENTQLKQQLSSAKSSKPKRRRPGNRNTKPLRHLRIGRKVKDAIVQALQGRVPTGEFQRRTGRQVPMGERVEELQNKFVFSLSSKMDPISGQPDLNVRMPGDGSRMFRVVAVEDAPRLIRSVYEHPGEGGYRGRDAMYTLLRRSYVGITRQDVSDFLSKRVVRQQLQRKTKRLSTAILPNNKRGVWQIDFIKIKKPNNNYRYVCVIVDMYSKYLWAFPLKQRTQEIKKNTSNKYNNVLININDADFIRKLRLVLESEKNGPEVMQSDNEFRSQEYLDLMREKGIKVSYSLPYSPQTNGGVERTNGTLKGCLLKCMINENGKWIERNGRSGCLPLCVHSYNNHKHRSTGKSPVEVHRPYLYHSVERDMRAREGLLADEGDVFPGDRPPEASDNAPQPEVTRTLRRNARLRIEKQQQKPLKVGDLVRIRVIHSKPYTKHEKKSKIKELGGQPNWSEEIYRVAENLGRNRYSLADAQTGEALTTKRKYFVKGARNGIEKKRKIKLMRHQLLRIELPTPGSEPFDPELRDRIKAAMKKNISPAGFQDDGSLAAMPRELQTANRNQKRLAATKSYRLRTRHVNTRHNTRQSGNQLLASYRDPEEFNTLQAIQDVGEDHRDRSQARMAYSAEDKRRVEWELESMGLRSTGSMASMVSRLLIARPLNRLSTPQLRLRLASFSLQLKDNQPAALIALSDVGYRAQLLARLIRAIEGSRLRGDQLKKQLPKQAKPASQRKVDLFRAYVRAGEGSGLSDNTVRAIASKTMLRDVPGSDLDLAEARRWISQQTLDGHLDAPTPGDNTPRYQQYLTRMARPGIWGGEPEVKAAAERFGVRIVVHSKLFHAVNTDRSGNIYNPLTGPGSTTIHLLNLTNTHYRLLEPCGQQRTPPLTTHTVGRQQHQDTGAVAPYDQSPSGIRFSNYLRTKLHLCEVELGMDGNCLFHCIAKGLGAGFDHVRVRREIVAYMRAHPDRFMHFTL